MRNIFNLLLLVRYKLAISNYCPCANFTSIVLPVTTQSCNVKLSLYFAIMTSVTKQQSFQREAVIKLRLSRNTLSFPVHVVKSYTINLQSLVKVPFQCVAISTRALTLLIKNRWKRSITNIFRFVESKPRDLRESTFAYKRFTLWEKTPYREKNSVR